MNDEPVWSQWTEWSLSRPHSPRWPEPNRLYRVRNCVRPITDYNGESYHKCPGDFYEVKQNDIKVGSSFNRAFQSKVGCFFPMVAVSLLPHAEFGLNDHRKDAPHFIIHLEGNQRT